MKSGKILTMLFAIAIAATSLAMVSTNLHAEAGQGNLTINVTADKTSASQGDTITYTYTVYNGTSDNITNIAISDSKFGTISLPVTMLASTENVTATYAYAVLTSDLPGPIVNKATVQGTNSTSENLTATSDPVSVALTANKNLMTKAEILKFSGVPGKGIDTAPGLQKYFNSNSQAADHAGKKAKNGKNYGKNHGGTDDGETDD